MSSRISVMTRKRELPRKEAKSDMAKVMIQVKRKVVSIRITEKDLGEVVEEMVVVEVEKVEEGGARSTATVCTIHNTRFISHGTIT